MGLVAKESRTVKIKSFNLNYGTYERNAEEVHVVGRVVCAASRL